MVSSMYIYIYTRVQFVCRKLAHNRIVCYIYFWRESSTRTESSLLHATYTPTHPVPIIPFLQCWAKQLYRSSVRYTMHTGMEYVYIENAIAQLVSVESVRLQSASRSFAQQRPFNKLNLPTSKRNGSSFFPHRDYYCLFSAAVSNREKEIGRRKPGWRTAK